MKGAATRARAGKSTSTRAIAPLSFTQSLWQPRRERSHLPNANSGVLRLPISYWLVPCRSLPADRVLDKRRHIVVELLHALVANVDHVSRLVPLVINVLRQRLRNGQVLFFIL